MAYPPEVIQVYLDIAEGKPVMDKIKPYHVDGWILHTYEGRDIITALEEDPTQVKVYADDIAVVFVEKSLAR
jgi:hypothetical protein